MLQLVEKARLLTLFPPPVLLTQFQEHAETENFRRVDVLEWEDRKIYVKNGFGVDVEITWSTATSELDYCAKKF